LDIYDTCLNGKICLTGFHFSWVIALPHQKYTFYGDVSNTLSKNIWLLGRDFQRKKSRDSDIKSSTDRQALGQFISFWKGINYGIIQLENFYNCSLFGEFVCEYYNYSITLSYCNRKVTPISAAIAAFSTKSLSCFTLQY